MDDLLDVTADPEKLGKPIGSDARSGKTTYVSLLGVERCRQIIGDLTRQAKSALKKMNTDTGFLSALTDYLAGRNY